ncbi:glycerol-3-phosphate dehydrogenase/oxidase [Ruegeria arenilitoris]|uniref:glycerol-3-phosphate dehydrogenase/oxidase n=1 Tax=Ruegeria arenilitoris TaxID=1173585 RepID=UPI00147B4939|nr:glycerol-3-phosphate dehydrogenase/oxidase [Ruegeria arenilitoris]
MPNQRQNMLAHLENPRFDAVVIGGGVNGIGVWRDLALQGLRVLLVERNDFASGCSAAPSRMIHGGLRYLENGEFDLVRESLAERDALLRNAPHLVRPLPTVIPIAGLTSGLFNAAASFFGWSGKPARRGALPIKIGLTLYDFVTRHRRQTPKHRFLSRSKTRAVFPALTRDARCAALYHDAWISHPERLCIEMIRDTLRDAPDAAALNYAEMALVDGCYYLTDLRGGKKMPVAPKVVVNATGAWLDETREALGADAPRMISGTKGSHLILRNDALLQALAGHMVYFENADGRVCIAFPYLGHVLVGSTDIRVDGAARTKCEPEERDYILGSLRSVFPDLTIDAGQIVFSYSGIRPLPQSDADFTGRISRGHYVQRLDGVVPQFCMVGGKWTTFRAFAEQAADEVLRELGQTRRGTTSDLSIGGGRGYSPTASLPVSEARATHLLDHYGAQAEEVLANCPEDDAPLFPGLPHTRGEIACLARSEFVQTLSDLALRRTSLAVTGSLTDAVIDALADVLAKAQDLTPDEIAAQRAMLVAELNTYHGQALTLSEDKKERSIECA